MVRQEETEQAPDRRLSALATSVQSVTSDNLDNRVLRTTYKCISCRRSILAYISLGAPR